MPTPLSQRSAAVQTVATVQIDAHTQTENCPASVDSFTVHSAPAMAPVRVPLPPTPSQHRARAAQAQAAPFVQRFLTETCAHACADLVADLAKLGGKAIGAPDHAAFNDVYAFLMHCFEAGNLDGAHDCIALLATACTERGKVGSPFAKDVPALLQQHVYPRLEAALVAHDWNAAAPSLRLFAAAAGDRDKKFVAEEHALHDKLSDVLRPHVWSPLHRLISQAGLREDDMQQAQTLLQVLSSAGEAGRSFTDDLMETLVGHLEARADINGNTPTDRLARAVCDALSAMWLSRTDEPRPILLAHPRVGSPVYSLSVRRDDYTPSKPEVILRTPGDIFYLRHDW